MTKCHLGWGQFAKVIDFAFERHFLDKNIVYLRSSRAIGPWQNHRILKFCVNYFFLHKAPPFHPTQVFKLILAVFWYILHSPIGPVGFLPDTITMNVVDEGIACLLMPTALAFAPSHQ